MKELGADVALAVELIEGWEGLWWSRLAEGLYQPTPRISDADLERLEEAQALLAAHSKGRASYVQAAIWNLGRVLGDAGAAFDYDVEPKEHYFMARAWYRGVHGAKRWALVEEWEVHTALIQNLAIELVRAVNLVITRARQAEEGVLAGQALAVIEVGPAHALLEAVTYTDKESMAPQPYPGLRGFPAVIASREPGGFGTYGDDRPRQRPEFERWVGRIEEERGAASGPPPAEDPPFSLEPPRAASVPQDSGRLLAAYAVLGVFAVIGGLLERPWLLGAAVGAALVTWWLHPRVWRRAPDPRAVLITALAALLFGALAQLGADQLDPEESGSAKGAGSGVAKVSAEAEWGPPRQTYRCDANGHCDGGGHVSLDSTVNNPDYGDERFFFSGKVLGTVGGVKDRIAVEPGDVVQLRVVVANDADPARRPALVARGVRAWVEVPAEPAREVRLVAWLEAENANPGQVFDSLYIVASEPVVLELASGSAALVNQVHQQGLALGDEILGAGVLLGVSRLDGRIGPLARETGVVMARVRVRAG